MAVNAETTANLNEAAGFLRTWRAPLRCYAVAERLVLAGKDPMAAALIASRTPSKRLAARIAAR